VIEPYITLLSYVAYRLLHHEVVCFRAYQPQGGPADPWAGNLATANLLFDRERESWPDRHPELRILHRRLFSILDFQLAAGFKPYSLAPGRRLYDLILRLDRWLDPIAPLCGFRIFCVIEKAES
jgi:hypothetical protein